MDSKNIKADKIIRNHMAWSLGAGLIPLPIVDFFAVGAIQLDMIRQLCKIYQVDFREKDVKAIISSLTGAGTARLGANLIKFIPGVGTVVGGVAMSILSAASTYAVGEIFKQHLDEGGTILDIDGESLKKMYDDLFEKGKEIAEELKDELKEVKEKVSNEASPGSPKTEYQIEKLKELAQMLDRGLITESEFISLKKSLLKDIDQDS